MVVAIVATVAGGVEVGVGVGFVVLVAIALAALVQFALLAGCSGWATRLLRAPVGAQCALRWFG